MLNTRIPDTRKLSAVAGGQLPADIVIKNGIWICVQSGEFIHQTDIAILGDTIAYVGPDACHTMGDSTTVIEANGRYLSPGFLDAHMHIESGMLSISEFVKAVIPHGTTGIFADPHEIANVLGIKGVRLMVDEGHIQPIHIWMQIPSCVPSVPTFEDPGASVSLAEIKESLQWDGVAGLGELMNFPGVIEGNELLHQEVAAALRAGKTVGGHYASVDLGHRFHAYVAGGAQDDHEGTTRTDAVARVRQGMKSMLRYGSAWHDVQEGVRAITENQLDSRHFILCTDDCHPATLLHEGHVNRAINQAIKCGVNPIEAIQMATLNTAEHFHVERHVGQIAPGRIADILLFPDILNVQPELVIANGKVVFGSNGLHVNTPEYKFPDWCMHSVHIQRRLVPNDFLIKTHLPLVNAHIIEIIENQAPTLHRIIPMTSSHGVIKPDKQNDIALAAVIDRHRASGSIQLGLVKGFRLSAECAIGSTVAHDSHQMVIIGTDESNMAIAANQLNEVQGGQVVVKDQKIIGQVTLPIAGLMSKEPVNVVAGQVDSVLAGFRACGCNLNNPNMQLSLLGLIVIPELRLTNRGLFDVEKFSLIPLLEPPVLE